MLGAPPTHFSRQLAGIMVIGPHHAAVTHVGGSSEVGQREHMVRQARVHKEVLVWVSVSWWLYIWNQSGISPRRAK
jgi:hypothetical protein